MLVTLSIVSILYWVHAKNSLAAGRYPSHYMRRLTIFIKNIWVDSYILSARLLKPSGLILDIYGT